MFFYTCRTERAMRAMVQLKQIELGEGCEVPIKRAKHPTDIIYENVVWSRTKRRICQTNLAVIFLCYLAIALWVWVAALNQ